MLSIKEATAKAVEYFKEMPGHSYHANSTIVEEVELTDDEKFWIITLGYPVETAKNITDILNPQVKKEYKTFKIYTDSGKLKSIKIRALS